MLTSETSCVSLRLVAEFICRAGCAKDCPGSHIRMGIVGPGKGAFARVPVPQLCCDVSASVGVLRGREFGVFEGSEPEIRSNACHAG